MTAPAERTRSAQPIAGPPRLFGGLTPAETAVRLRWLSPGCSSLLSLARSRTPFPLQDLWPTVRLDPGAVLLLLRASAPPDSSLPFPEASLLHPAPLDLALALLETAEPPRPAEGASPAEQVPLDGFVCWSQPEAQPIYRTCVHLASVTHRLALRLSLSDTERAWVCGLLAPLGWLVMTAVAPASVSACLLDPGLNGDALAVQRRHWGLDQGSVIRRVGRAWGLPDWLLGVIANLGLPIEQAVALGADARLLALTRQAIWALRGTALALPGCHPALAAADARLLRLGELGDEVPDEGGLHDWQNPREVPLLRDLLRLAAENRRLSERGQVRQLEGEVDELHRGLETQFRTEDDRLRSARLAALAEFSGGAGHEINNPLAVISGQAQYLLSHADWLVGGTEGPAGEALGVIIAQTRRIHGILRDLMQFARPRPSRLAWTDLPALLGTVLSSQEELAQGRRVRLELHCGLDRFAVFIDPEQVRTALVCLLRNAIEAANGPDGWARLVLVAPRGDGSVAVRVEDSGPGPTPAQRPHLFDPFFSGRSAGRGRGMGLPIAWRMARQHGGDVYLEPARLGEPTRFVLRLPTGEASSGVREESPGEASEAA